MLKLVDTLFSIYAWTIFVIITLLCSVAIILASLLGPFADPNARIPHAIGFIWARSFFFMNPGWKIKVQGRGYVKRTRNYVLVSNHTSMSDILSIFLLNRQFKWVAKDSLFYIPFFGWAMSAMRYVRLKRGHHGSIRDSVRETRKWLNKRGVSVLIFPEGTRSKTGKLKSFKNGAFKLAIESKKPIVPIVVTGTHDMIQKGSALFSPIVNCKIKVLKPIERYYIVYVLFKYTPQIPP